jgi:hypothetical protein
MGQHHAPCRPVAAHTCAANRKWNACLLLDGTMGQHHALRRPVAAHTCAANRKWNACLLLDGTMGRIGRMGPMVMGQ